MAKRFSSKYNNDNNAQSGNFNYGDILRNAREKHGISISEIAEELHVRHDIVESLEAGDFSQIPPQGYSRNMVKSYARILGLDANKLTNMFLDSEYSYRIGKKREKVQQISDENKKHSPQFKKNYSSTMTPRQQIEHGFNNDPQDIPSDSFINKKRSFHQLDNGYRNTPRSRGSFNRDYDTNYNNNIYRNSTRLTNDLMSGNDSKSARERLEARKRQENSPGSRAHSPFNSGNRKSALKQRQSLSRSSSYNLTDEENPNFINNDSLKNNRSGFQLPNISKGPISTPQSKLAFPIIVAAVILLIVVLIIVFFIVGKQHENDKTDVSKLNVVGISDIENAEKNNSDSSNNKQKETKTSEEPKEAVFKYVVKDGQSVYMEIYENGNSRPTLAREVKSGETNTFNVTDKLKFITTKPSAVDIFVNNEAVSPQDTSSNGIYTYNLDFQEYLKQ